MSEESEEIAAISRPRPYNGDDSWVAMFQVQSSAARERLRESRASSEGRTIFDSTEERLDRAEAQIEFIYSILEEITKA